MASNSTKRPADTSSDTNPKRRADNIDKGGWESIRNDVKDVYGSGIKEMIVSILTYTFTN